MKKIKRETFFSDIFVSMYSSYPGRSEFSPCFSQGCFKYVAGRSVPGGYRRKDELDRKGLTKISKALAAKEKLFVSDLFKI